MNAIDEFVKTSTLRIQDILSKFNWTEEGIFRDNNTKANATTNALEEDVELPLPPSCSASNSVFLEDKELRQLLNDPNARAPQKFSDLQINFSREEKLLLYEHAVKQKKDVKVSATFDEDLVSFAEIVAMKNREKKKRRKYRISKPTQTEEVRCLVELQMQALQQLLESKEKTEILLENYERKRQTNRERSKSTERYVKREDYKDYGNRQDKASTSKNTSRRIHKDKMRDVPEHSVKERRRHEFSESRSRRDSRTEKRKRHSRSCSRDMRHRNRSRSPYKKEMGHKRRSRTRSPKRKKEKHKRSNKSRKKSKRRNS